MNLPNGSASISASLASDTRSLQALRAKAGSDPKAAVKEAAKQFEALFMQEVMKSMRASVQSSGMLDNAGSQMGTEMLDTQLANKLAGMPGGLADAIARQLERQMGGKAAEGSSPTALPRRAGASAATAAGEATTAPPTSVRERQSSFLSKVQDAAASVAQATGIPASFMMAQAAHESGWGRREIKNADGSSSHNIFGIKAGANWDGPTTEVTTTEVIGGVARKVVASFRAYASYADAFADYAKLLTGSPRYANVVAQADSAEGFARGLQRAGYATDPAYADKLTRVINTTLRLQRGQA